MEVSSTFVLVLCTMSWRRDSKSFWLVKAFKMTRNEFLLVPDLRGVSTESYCIITSNLNSNKIRVLRSLNWVSIFHCVVLIISILILFWHALSFVTTFAWLCFNFSHLLVRSLLLLFSRSTFFISNLFGFMSTWTAIVCGQHFFGSWPRSNNRNSTSVWPSAPILHAWAIVLQPSDNVFHCLAD